MHRSVGNSIGKGLLASPGFGIVPISYVDYGHWPIEGWGAAVKRAIDVSIALVGLIVFAFPMLLAALVIRLESRGPAVFHQTRIGFANVSFDMRKFRTMREHESGQGRLMQATRDDRRVTPFGRVLRHCSFDELPQLFNVLRGDMSLVGPRPHAPGTCAGGKPFEMITPHYAARHRVRPGITGLAQVRGLRGETDTEDKLLRRVEADLEYIDTWSLWLDIKILARTIVPVTAMRNAY